MIQNNYQFHEESGGPLYRNRCISKLIIAVYYVHYLVLDLPGAAQHLPAVGSHQELGRDSRLVPWYRREINIE